MNNGGDAAEQVVRLSLEGFEVAARLSGSAAKNIALLLVSVLKQEQKTKGKARLISLLDAVLDMKEALRRQFTNRKHLSEQIDLIDKAIALSKENIDDLEAIREIGQGWVAEETLSIAIYCSLKYSDDFDKAIIASVNHSGDSDSTGAVTGNILGAYLGLKSIPQKYLDNLELKDVILEIADDLYNDCKISEYGSYHDEIWEQKYIYKTYKRTK